MLKTYLSTTRPGGGWGKIYTADALLPLYIHSLIDRLTLRSGGDCSDQENSGKSTFYNNALLPFYLSLPFVHYTLALLLLLRLPDVLEIRSLRLVLLLLSSSMFVGLYTQKKLAATAGSVGSSSTFIQASEGLSFFGSFSLLLRRLALRSLVESGINHGGGLAVGASQQPLHPPLHAPVHVYTVA